MGCADIVLELVGLRRFFADLDRDRQYWRDAPGSVVATILDWAGGAGFEACFWERADEFPWRTALEFRQRYMRRMSEF